MRPIYERHADLVELTTLRRLGESVRGRENAELFRFGCETYLGELTREERGENRRAGERPSRRRTTAARSATGCCRRRSRTPPTAPRAPGSRRRGTTARGAPEPALPRGHRTTQRAVPDLGAATYFDLYRDRFHFDLEGLAVGAAPSSTRRRGCTRRVDGPRAARARRRRPRGGRAARPAALLPRLGLGRRLPRPTGWCPRCAARWPGSGSTSTRRQRPPRRRAADEEPRAFCARSRSRTR